MAKRLRREVDDRPGRPDFVVVVPTVVCAAIANEIESARALVG